MKLHHILIPAAVLAGVAVVVALLTGCGGSDKPSPTEAASRAAVLSFDSFDGGGPEYSVTVGDPSVVSYTSERRYAKEDHEELDGAGYDVIFTFTGLKAGSTDVTVSMSSSIMGSECYRFRADVDEGLNVTLTQLEDATDGDNIVTEPAAMFAVSVGDNIYPADHEYSPAVEELIAQLSSVGETEIELSDGDRGLEGTLPWSLPGSDGPVTAEAGDLVLYEGSRVVLCRGEESMDGIALLHIDSIADELGVKKLTLSMWVEWTE